MTRHKLKALFVSRVEKPGMYGDGDGLYLQVSASGGEKPHKSWIYRYWSKAGTERGKSREMGLGPFTALDLKAARKAAAECRALRVQGIDPIEARKAKRVKAAIEKASAKSFKEVAADYIALHRADWRSPRHIAQWERSLATYAEPIIGAMPIKSIDTGHVLKVLEPIWSEIPETASRLRGRIEMVLDWANLDDENGDKNPARYRGHLKKRLMQLRPKVRKVKHHAALAYAELPAFMAKLREQDGNAARALEFTILTVARIGETLGATDSEIREAERLWIIPGERMKAGRDHRVPLSDCAVSALQKAAELRNHASPYLFQDLSGKPLSIFAMASVQKRMGRADVTTHGFRSTFRDWAAERTNYPSEVVEMALAHAVGDKVEAAYRRGDLLEKRRRLMDEWARYASSSAISGDIVPMRRA